MREGGGSPTSLEKNAGRACRLVAHEQRDENGANGSARQRCADDAVALLCGALLGHLDAEQVANGLDYRQDDKGIVTAGGGIGPRIVEVPGSRTAKGCQPCRDVRDGNQAGHVLDAAADHLFDVGRARASGAPGSKPLWKSHLRRAKREFIKAFLFCGSLQSTVGATPAALACSWVEGGMRLLGRGVHPASPLAGQRPGCGPRARVDGACGMRHAAAAARQPKSSTYAGRADERILASGMKAVLSPSRRRQDAPPVIPPVTGRVRAQRPPSPPTPPQSAAAGGGDLTPYAGSIGSRPWHAQWTWCCSNACMAASGNRRGVAPCGQAAMGRVRRADVAEGEGEGGHDGAYRHPDGRTA